MITDMTVGKPSRVLWRFSLPLLVSVAFQQFYSIADSIIAGNLIPGGEDALAAIGASYPVTMLFMAFAVGYNSGCSVVASNLFGSRKMGRLRTAIYTSIISSLALSLILTLFGAVFSPNIVALLNTPANIFDDACVYLNIYIYGLPFLFLYNVCNGIFSALGDSKTPLYLLIGSSVGNVVLDIAMIKLFNMGVDGVAWATFTAQSISAVLALITLLIRIKKLDTDSEKPKLFSGGMLGKISLIAIRFHSPAKLRFGRQPFYSGYCKQLRLLGDYCGLFRSRKAQHLCNNLRCNHVERYVKLYGAERRRRQYGQGIKGL